MIDACRQSGEWQQCVDLLSVPKTGGAEGHFSVRVKKELHSLKLTYLDVS